MWSGDGDAVAQDVLALDNEITDIPTIWKTMRLSSATPALRAAIPSCILMARGAVASAAAPSGDEEHGFKRGFPMGVRNITTPSKKRGLKARL
jgi:hypothetical protein